MKRSLKKILKYFHYVLPNKFPGRVYRMVGELGRLIKTRCLFLIATKIEARSLEMSAYWTVGTYQGVWYIILCQKPSCLTIENAQQYIFPIDFPKHCNPKFLICHFLYLSAVNTDVFEFDPEAEVDWGGGGGGGGNC